jgi:hypothetical protein
VALGTIVISTVGTAMLGVATPASGVASATDELHAATIVTNANIAAISGRLPRLN